MQERKTFHAVLSCVKALVVLLAALFSVGASSSLVHAADSGLSIDISVFDQVVVNGTTERQPVPGVTVLVKTEAGVAVGEFVTGTGTGTVSVPVPEKAGYTVELVLSSLPSGMSLIDENKAIAVITKDAFTTSNKKVTFFTGSVGESGASAFERIAQRFADGVRLGLVIAMCSVGLSLIFGTTGLTNFAHGEMVAFGGLTMFLFNVTLGIPLLIAAPNPGFMI